MLKIVAWAGVKGLTFPPNLTFPSHNLAGRPEKKSEKKCIVMCSNTKHHLEPNTDIDLY